MPRFSDCCENCDMFICQVCAVDKCSGCKFGERIDLTNITGFKGTGNVCSSCLPKVAGKPATDQKPIVARYAGVCTECNERFTAGTDILWSKAKGSRHAECPVKLVSLHEYCREESGGLTGVALERYINRYYGHN